MKTVLKGGTIISAKTSYVADIAMEDGIIIAVGEHLPTDNAVVRDVTGKLLFPGFIDGHTHFDLDVCNTTTADDFASGSCSALLGGTTMIIDFACPNKGESLAYGLGLWREKSHGKTACDYSYHMTIDDWNDNISKELPAMIDAGITSFKMYMTYPAMMIGDEDMYHALKKIHQLGGIAGVHCENSGVIDALVKERKEAGDFSPHAHALSRPSGLEAEAISSVLRIAQSVGCPIIIVHLTSIEGMKEVEIARKRGQTVYVETCPHYLFLDDRVYEQDTYIESAKCICAPPLRKITDQKALREGLSSGSIQTIATDHCSFTTAQKMAGEHDFTKIPGGLPGVETRGILLYQLVMDQVITQEKMVELLCENPAKLYGIFPKKGIIAAGSDGDIVILNPNKNGEITEKNQHSKADYTPYEGMKTRGNIEAVYLRGELVVDGGILQKDSNGVFVARRAPNL